LTSNIIQNDVEITLFLTRLWNVKRSFNLQVGSELLLSRCRLCTRMLVEQ